MHLGFRYGDLTPLNEQFQKLMQHYILIVKSKSICFKLPYWLTRQVIRLTQFMYYSDKNNSY